MLGGGRRTDIWLYGNSPLNFTEHWPFGPAAQKRKDGSYFSLVEGLAWITFFAMGNINDFLNE